MHHDHHAPNLDYAGRAWAEEELEAAATAAALGTAELRGQYAGEGPASAGLVAELNVRATAEHLALERALRLCAERGLTLTMRPDPADETGPIVIAGAQEGTVQITAFADTDPASALSDLADALEELDGSRLPF